MADKDVENKKRPIFDFDIIYQREVLNFFLGRNKTVYFGQFDKKPVAINPILWIMNLFILTLDKALQVA